MAAEKARNRAVKFQQDAEAYAAEGRVGDPESVLSVLKLPEVEYILFSTEGGTQSQIRSSATRLGVFFKSGGSRSWLFTITMTDCGYGVVAGNS